VAQTDSRPPHGREGVNARAKDSDADCGSGALVRADACAAIETIAHVAIIAAVARVAAIATIVAVAAIDAVAGIGAIAASAGATIAAAVLGRWPLQLG
jgi:hypothetical protein